MSPASERQDVIPLGGSRLEIRDEEDERWQVSVEQAEADYYAWIGKRQLQGMESDRSEAMRQPMGFQNEKWEALKAQMRPGDELWEFRSTRAMWAAAMGRSGYELRREGVIVAWIISRMN